MDSLLFDYLTPFNPLNTGLARYSDPHVSYDVLYSQNLLHNYDRGRAEERDSGGSDHVKNIRDLQRAMQVQKEQSLVL